MFVANLKNSWKFSWSSGKISLSSELQRVSNSTARFKFQIQEFKIQFCLQNIVLNHGPKDRYKLIAHINLLSVLCWNYNLIVLVGDCAIFCFLLITEMCFPFWVSLKWSYSKMYKVILNLLYVYSYYALLLIKIKVFCLCNCDFSIILLLFHLSLSFKSCPFTLANIGVTPWNNDCLINSILETDLWIFGVNDFNLLNKVVYRLDKISNNNIMNHQKWFI